MSELDGRLVMITGGGRGIGRGISEALTEAGARVVVTDLDVRAAEETVTTLRRQGRQAEAAALDVSDDAAVTETIRRFEELDGLVNNAGVLTMAPAVEASRREWDRQLQVNVQGVFNCARAVARLWLEKGRGGSIVNVASNAGKVGYPNMAAYNASKAAVISLTRSLAMEWAPHGINVNAVCPGGVRTAMLDDVARWMAERSGGDASALVETMVPPQLGRHIEPVEVGRVVAFLLSDAAAIIRGQAINVDGGEAPY